MVYRSSVLFLVVLTCCLFLANCSSGTPPVSTVPLDGTTVTVNVLEPDARAPITVGTDVVDTVEVNGYDSAGNRIVGPLRASVSESMEFPGVPRGVSALKVEYLRNRGFTIMRAIVRLPEGTGADAVSLGTGTLRVENPQQSVTSTSPVSSFRFESLPASGSTNPPNVPGFQLIATYPDNSTLDNPPTDHPIMLQGVCYAPSPIGYNSGTGPALSDLFWDNYQGPNGTVFGWSVLWSASPGFVPPPTVFRNDIDTIRNTLSCNAIRVYSMLSQQLNDAGNGFNSQIFTHQSFLDYCFNNGSNPVFVLITLTPPSSDFQAQVAPQPPTSAEWKTNISQMVAEVGPSPAVLGFIVMNELDQAGSAFNQSGGSLAPATTDTDFFYDATSDYIQLCKAPFPNKLVGWAAHDSPQLLYYMVNYSNTVTGVPYARQISDPSPSPSASPNPTPSPVYGFDFWGVNTYQAATLDSVLGPEQITEGLTFAQLPTEYQKPVIFTEIGYPAAEHVTDNGPLQESVTAQNRAAEVLTRVFTEAFSNAAPPSPNPSYSPNPPDYVPASTPISVPYPQILVGTFYFEFNDEWDKGGNNFVDSSGNWSWNANAVPDPNRPNGYDDEASFGLYSDALPSGVALNRNPYPPDNGAPAAPVDSITARGPLVDAISAFYSQQFVNPGTPGP